MNPNKETTKIFSPGIINIVENKIIAVNSRVPKPAKVTGIKPTALAIGNNKRKYKYLISSPSDKTIIYS